MKHMVEVACKQLFAQLLGQSLSIAMLRSFSHLRPHVLNVGLAAPQLPPGCPGARGDEHFVLLGGSARPVEIAGSSRPSSSAERRAWPQGGPSVV